MRHRPLTGVVLKQYCLEQQKTNGKTMDLVRILCVFVFRLS